MKTINSTKAIKRNTLEEHTQNSAKETLPDMFLLIDSPFVHMLKEYSNTRNQSVAIDKLESLFREFVGSLYTCFGADTNYPNLYRLINLTKSELTMLKTKIEHIGLGEKCAF